MKKKLFILLFIIFIAHLGFRIFQYSGEYLTKYDAKYWEGRYLHSQWVVPNSKETIGDDGLYAYVGHEYIIGRDPTTLNAELPPFGKYLIGLSILLFNNQNIFALFSGLLVFVGLFFVNKIIFKDNFWAFLPVFFLSLDPLFFTQLRAPFLDLLYLGLLLFTFLFFLQERFFVAAVFFGLMIATKASTATFVLVGGAMILYLLYMKHTEQIKKVLLSFLISIGVFVFTYLVFFLKGHTPLEFLSVQKWIFDFYSSGAKGDPLSALQILATGNWPTWWGGTIHVSEWTILWPIALLGTVYYLLQTVVKRKVYPSVLLGFWVVIYLIFLAFVPVWPRYLLLVLPFMYTLSVWLLTKSKAIKFLTK